MAVGSAFGALTELIEQLEATDRDVLGVVTEDIGVGDDDSLVVSLAVRTSLFDDVDTDGIDLAARSASVNDDGTATIDLAVSIPRSIRSGPAARSNGHAGGEDRTRESTGADDRRRGGDVPVHRDPDRLREVYATCDTFTEMTEALGADVTSVTVRRNMIKHGIHEPRPNGSPARDDGGGETGDRETGVGGDRDDGTRGESEATEEGFARTDDHPTDDGVPADASTPSTDESPADDRPGDDGSDDPAVSDETSDSVPGRSSSSDDEPATSEAESAESVDEVVAIPDGIGFPRDLTLDGLAEVVSTSNTLHEAGTRLGLDRDRTRELLGDLGVLDLVHGRVATRHERAASPKEASERIHERLSRSA